VTAEYLGLTAPKEGIRWSVAGQLLQDPQKITRTGECRDGSFHDVFFLERFPLVAETYRYWVPVKSIMYLISTTCQRFPSPVATFRLTPADGRPSGGVINATLGGPRQERPRNPDMISLKPQ
jgi:hypothetical protein